MSIKQDRLAERIRTILSELLLREVSDPRLHNITITEVRLNPELLFADVYVNALGDENRRDDVLQGLAHARGFLRREIGRHIRLRQTPDLHFYWDKTLERGERLHQLIDDLDIPPEETVDDRESDRDG